MPDYTSKEVLGTKLYLDFFQRLNKGHLSNEWQRMVVCPRINFVLKMLTYISVTRSGNLLDFGHLFKAIGNN